MPVGRAEASEASYLVDFHQILVDFHQILIRPCTDAFSPSYLVDLHQILIRPCAGSPPRQCHKRVSSSVRPLAFWLGHRARNRRLLGRSLGDVCVPQMRTAGPWRRTV
jgi:hypothetical protein